jgi:hypothetical protein
MRFTFELEARHIRAFNNVATRRLRARTKETWKLFPAFLIAWMPFGYALGTYIQLYNENRNIRSDLLLTPCLLSVTAAMIWLAGKYKARLRSAAARDESFSRAHHSVLAEPGYLEIVSAGVKTTYEWPRFVEVLEDLEALYLFLDLREAVVIPKSAFADLADAQQFDSWLRGSNKSLQPTCEDARG